MKKKKYIFALLLALTVGGTTSCSLDVVPDEMETEEDAFEDRNAALRYVYSCYSYLPNPRSGSESLDFMTGDEIISPYEHEPFANFPKGNYTSSSPGISYWNTFFQGLRQCWLFINNVDKVPDLTADLKKDYVAQVKFLIAYYHYLLIRCYGPTIIVDRQMDMSTPAEEYAARRPLDECVEYVCNMFQEAANDLPPKRSTVYEYGLATSVAAKALIAKMRVYAASPLFNGNNKFYADFKNNDGTQLMPTSYDANKWVVAQQALKEAIDFAEQNGHSLYTKTDYQSSENPYPLDATQHCLRYGIVEPGNSEILFAYCGDENGYGMQIKSMPYQANALWNGVSPTWAMLNRFYTKNGLPLSEDPEYKNQDNLEIVTVDDSQADMAAPGYQTIKFNLNREPRFYAWIAFQGGYFEVNNDNSTPAYDVEGDHYVDGHRLICDFVLGGNCSRKTSGDQQQRTNDYSPTCYLNKKGVDASFTASTAWKAPVQYPWPLVRLADLYLHYAEACIEVGGEANLSLAKQYLNKIRTRAGIPTVEESWKGVATLDQNKLRDIVRQERMIELYLENQNFWDMRRWLLAEQYFNVKAKGLKTDANSIQEMAQIEEVPFERKFSSPTNYLLPIPNKDVNANPNLVNNPGY